MMSFTPDVSDDCLLVDGTESVTLEGSATIIVAGAKRGQLVQSELQLAALGLSTDDVAWNLPEVNLASIEPRIGDVIADANQERWTIVSVSSAVLSGVRRALCRRHR